MLYGRYQHNIDAKGRIFVPAKLREKLGEQFIAAAVMDHCVCLYSLEEWDKLQQGLAAAAAEVPHVGQAAVQSVAARLRIGMNGI